MNITFDITKSHALNLGQQYDHNLTTVTFVGFVPEDVEHAIYLKVDGVGLYPLLDFEFVVSQVFTLKAGVIKGQLLEVASDGTLIKNSKVFDMMVKPSLNEDVEIVDPDLDIDLYYDKLSELYQTVSNKLESGEFNGKSAYEIAVEHGYEGTEEEWIDWNSDDLTFEKIVNGLGYEPADANDVPVVHEWALQESKPRYTLEELGAMSADTYIPEKVSDLENDEGFISDVSDKLDVSTFEEYVVRNDAAVNRLSSGNNYELVNSITLSADTLTVVCSTDKDGNDIDLSSVAIILSNPSGINGGSNAICRVYDSNDESVGDTPVYFFANASVIKAALEISINGAIVFMNSIGWTAASYSPTNKSLINESGGAENIAKIELVGNGNSFRKGTVINIYGVSNS